MSKEWCRGTLVRQIGKPDGKLNTFRLLSGVRSYLATLKLWDVADVLIADNATVALKVRTNDITSFDGFHFLRY